MRSALPRPRALVPLPKGARRETRATSRPAPQDHPSQPSPATRPGASHNRCDKRARVPALPVPLTLPARPNPATRSAMPGNRSTQAAPIATDPRAQRAPCQGAPLHVLRRVQAKRPAQAKTPAPAPLPLSPAQPVPGPTERRAPTSSPPRPRHFCHTASYHIASRANRPLHLVPLRQDINHPLLFVPHNKVPPCSMTS